MFAELSLPSSARVPANAMKPSTGALLLRSRCETPLFNQVAEFKAIARSRTTVCLGQISTYSETYTT